VLEGLGFVRHIHSSYVDVRQGLANGGDYRRSVFVWTREVGYHLPHLRRRGIEVLCCLMYFRERVIDFLGKALGLQVGDERSGICGRALQLAGGALYRRPVYSSRLVSPDPRVPRRATTSRQVPVLP